MEMEDEITKLKPLLRALAEGSQAQAGDHLTAEQLDAYHFKELSGDEAERIQDHLALCRECASLLLDLAEFCAPDQEVRAILPLQAESRAAEAERQSSFQPEPQSAPSFFRRLRELFISLRFVYASAALSLALILLLAVWLRSLKEENRGLIARNAEAARKIEETQMQRDQARALSEQLEAQVDELTRPQLNVPIIDLPLGSVRSQGDSNMADVELSESDNYFALILPPPDQNYPDYDIEILRQRGESVINERGLQPDKVAGVFKIMLPRALFPPGVYRFNVYGIGRGERTRVSGGAARIRYKQ